MDQKTLEQELTKANPAVTIEDLESLFPDKATLIKEVYSVLKTVPDTAYAILIASLYDEGGLEIIRDCAPRTRTHRLFDAQILNEQRLMRRRREIHHTPHNPEILISILDETYWDKTSSGQIGAGPTHVPNYNRTNGRK